ncbi:hypothetical protein DVS28_a1020 [Euzebya pacifica]|uniref:Uncharacterized protein n=1 Tax=Euzebya pacifica TaxID=1608957 RepID=A0A346XU24_9ACTN|nr:hypothetical protein [Euzebya pacifica]AXV05721.1 hypothetical protein DVS28_a1020 [Euzebya pacifica]
MLLLLSIAAVYLVTARQDPSLEIPLDAVPAQEVDVPQPSD